MAQRNLVDVPSSEIVEPKKIFLQGEITFERENINTSAIFTYGLPGDWEVGLVFYKVDFKRSEGVQISSDHPEENPDVLLAVQKGFKLSDWFKLGLGTQFGVNVVKSHQDLRFVNFNFVNTQFSFGARNHMIVAGVYYGDDAYVTQGTNAGIMAGIDLNLSKDKLHLVADFFSGTSAISVINVALQISVGKSWKIMGGAQLPVAGSDNEHGGILQVSKN